MTSRVTHPLVSAYLRDLELLLAGVEPGERAEVIAGVHEHLDASLSPDASDDDVRAILAELGSPQSVADEAYAGRPTCAVAAGSAGRPRPGLMSRSWLPVVVGLLLGFALVLIVFMSAAGTGYGTSSTEGTDSAGNVIQGPVEVLYDGAFPVVALMTLLATVAVWFPALFLCWASPLWTAREKVVAGLALPLASVALTALPDIGWVLTDGELGINIGAWLGLAIALGGGGYVIVRTGRIGVTRASALAREGLA